MIRVIKFSASSFWNLWTCDIHIFISSKLKVEISGNTSTQSVFFTFFIFSIVFLNTSNNMHMFPADAQIRKTPNRFRLSQTSSTYRNSLQQQRVASWLMDFLKVVLHAWESLACRSCALQKWKKTLHESNRKTHSMTPYIFTASICPSRYDLWCLMPCALLLC